MERGYRDLVGGTRGLGFDDGCGDTYNDTVETWIWDISMPTYLDTDGARTRHHQGHSAPFLASGRLPFARALGLSAYPRRKTVLDFGIE